MHHIMLALCLSCWQHESSGDVEDNNVADVNRLSLHNDCCLIFFVSVFSLKLISGRWAISGFVYFFTSEQ